MRDALVALGNIAVVAKNQLLISKLGGLAFISNGLTSVYDSCHQFATRALYRMSALAENQVKIIEAGCVPSLNRLCESKQVLVRKYSATTLCNISVRENLNLQWSAIV